MSEELSNATRIAALEGQVRQLTEELDAMTTLHDRERIARKEAESRAESLSHSIMAACTGSGCLNAHELRVALDASKAREEAYRADVVREQHPWTVRLSIATVDGYEVCECTVADIGHADRILLVTCDDVTDMRVDLATERERCGVLERECRKWRAWCDAEDSVAINEPLLYQDAVNARRETDTRHALDAAKFVGGAD